MFTEEELLEIYENHKQELLVYLYRLIFDNQAAEDLLHDAFISFIQQSQKSDIRDPKAYLYRIAHNLAVNYIKKHNRVAPLTPEIESEKLYYDQTEEHVVSQELQQKIDELLLDCDPEGRSFFIMKKELGFTSVEIAEKTGKSERTVRRKIQKVTEYILKSLKKSDFL